MTSKREDRPTATPPARIKPRWRGVVHHYAFLASILPAVALVSSAPTFRSSIAAGIYATSLAALLGTSALYHRVTWSPRARFWVGRLDLSMIFVLIAGSYTPIALLALDPAHSRLALWLVWGAAAAGSVLKIAWRNPPKWASALVYVTIGSIGAVFAPEIARSIGSTATTMLAAGGALYILGAVVYALQRPDPLPAVFGYHEIFHSIVVVAAAVHFVALAAYVLPIAG